MQSRVSNVLMLMYDVGERIEPLQEIPESESVEHEKLLSQEQIDSLMAEFEAWLDADGCMSQNAEYRADEIEVYRRYLEREQHGEWQHYFTASSRSAIERARRI